MRFFHYVEPRHKIKFIDIMWNIGQAIHGHNYIDIDYIRMKDKAMVRRKLKPVAIMFSEYYFYLTAFIDDKDVRKNFDVINDSFPTYISHRSYQAICGYWMKNSIFHIAADLKKENFASEYSLCMVASCRKVKFQYFGNDIDAVLDRLPTAKILSEEEGVYTVAAEVFGKGIDMWLKSQGSMIKNDRLRRMYL